MGPRFPFFHVRLREGRHPLAIWCKCDTIIYSRNIEGGRVAARSGTVPWFESFNVEAEVADLLAHIERCTGFALLARQRAVIMTHARAKLDRTMQAYLEAKTAGKPVSTSRRAYLTDLQDTIFMAIPEENLALMPLRERQCPQICRSPEAPRACTAALSPGEHRVRPKRFSWLEPYRGWPPQTPFPKGGALCSARKPLKAL